MVDYTTYELHGEIRDKVIAIFDLKDCVMTARKAYCVTIGAVPGGVVCRGPDVSGFIFKKPANPPDRWVWKGTVRADGETVEYALPQRRSAADKAEWDCISALRDNTAAKLNKLFYNDSWGFECGSRVAGVGAFTRGERAFAEIATEAAVLSGMEEILRSKYIAESTMA